MTTNFGPLLKVEALPTLMEQFGKDKAVSILDVAELGQAVTVTDGDGNTWTVERIDN